MLLAHGADARSCDDAGLTPLHKAAQFAATLGANDAGVHRPVVTLLAHGARAGAADAEGRTARALAGRYPSAPAVLLALLAAAERQEHLRRRLRVFAQVAARLTAWHARAVERTYAPGGCGFAEVRADFEERASKAQRAS